jgi:hypothetical protein
VGAFGALAPFGLLAFGDVPSPAEPVYRTMRASIARAFASDEGTHAEASIYARSLALGAVRATMRHGFEQRRPMRAVEMLATLEALFGVAPTRSQSDDSRRRVVASRKRIYRGSRPESLENALRALLGDAFIALHTPAAATLATFPASPADAGAWDAPSSKPRFFRLTSSVSLVGTPATFRYENLLGDGELIAAGDRLCCEPDNNVLVEAVTIAASSDGELEASATFQRPHAAGAVLRTHAPYWITNKRHITVIVNAAVAADPAVRGQVDALMTRLVRASTTWSVAAASGAATAGPFKVGESPIGTVPIGTITF